MDQSALLKELKIDRPRDGSAPARRWWIGWLVALVMLALGLGLWRLLAGDGASAVEVATVRALGTAPSTASVLDASGYITARRQATVSSKVTGRVREVYIEEGMRVEAGQLLATLDDTDARAARDLAMARLASARSQLAEIRTNLRNAERDAERLEELAARRLVSAQSADAARTAAVALRARLASAEREVAVAERSLNIAELGVADTEVRAPFAGVVTVKAAQPGEIVSPLSAGGGFTRTGIGTIVDMESLEIQVDVNENFINRVQPGQPVVATLNSYPDWRIPAEVIAIIPTADRSKATVKVRIALKERDARIVPDMGVRVAFLDETRRDGGAAQPPRGVLVPRAALHREAGEDVVYVVVDGRLVRRRVSLGTLSAGDAQQVVDGLQVDEIVLVGGLDAPREGLAVVVSNSGRR